MRDNDVSCVEVQRENAQLRAQVEALEEELQAIHFSVLADA